MYVEVKKIVKRYRDNIVLNKVNCEFDKGAVYGIYGHNGSGKTIFLKALAGLVRVNEGDIIVGGEKLSRGHEIPEDVSALIENPGLVSGYTGYDNIRTITEIRNRVTEEKIHEYMKAFGLDPNDKRKVRKYSLGMKQKVGLINALIEDSKLILLDEPTNALDEYSVKVLNSMINEKRDKGCTVIITSHNMEELRMVSDELYQMSNGEMKREF